MPLTLRRPDWRNGDGGSRTRSSSVQTRCSASRASSPCRCGRVESNHHSRRRRGYSAQSSPMLSVHMCRWPTGFEPVLRGSQPRVLAVTPQPPRTPRIPRAPGRAWRSRALPGGSRARPGARGGDDRTRTGDLPADNRLLLPLSYAPRASGAGGIRTHGLELMRLARTAAPLPRVALSRTNRSGRQESNLRSPAPEAGGVALLPHSQMKAPPAGLEPAASGLRARRHHRFDHGGKTVPFSVGGAGPRLRRGGRRRRPRMRGSSRPRRVAGRAGPEGIVR